MHFSCSSGDSVKRLCHAFQYFSGDPSAEHSFVTIVQAAQKLKAEFETLNKKCSEKLTRMCSLEKETWFDLDEMEQECDKLLEQVEKKAERLVRMKIRIFM